MSRIILLFFLIIGLVWANNRHGHGDHSVKYFKGFEKQKGLGVWYVIKKGPNEGPDHFDHMECMEEHYDQNPDNDHVIDYSVSFRAGGNVTVSHGFATVDPKAQYKMTFYFMNAVIPAYIVATDYTTWSVAATFFERPDGTQKTIYWILSRKQSLDQVILTTIETFIGLNPKDFKTFNHDNCPKLIQSLPGGTSREERPATQKIKDLVNRISPSIRENIEKSQGSNLNEVAAGSNMFEALSYKTQIVSGKNYFIKIRVNGENHGKIWHVRIYEHWSGSPLEVTKIAGPKDDAHPLEYFE